MRHLFMALVMCCAFMGGGCASKLMQPIVPQEAELAPLPPQESAIVFIRSTSFGGAVQAPVVEANNGQLKLVGIVSAGTKVRYLTTPGKHFFIVGGESSNILEADFDGGKTYYAYVDPKLGIMKARFEFIPVTHEEALSEKFKKDFDWCEWQAAKSDAAEWLVQNMESMLKKSGNAMAKEKRAVITQGYGIEQPLR